MGSKLWRGRKLWRICGQKRWLPFGEDFYLGAGYHQAVRLARSCGRCDEPGCGRILEKGAVYIDYWRNDLHEAFCLDHAPIPVELLEELVEQEAREADHMAQAALSQSRLKAR